MGNNTVMPLSEVVLTTTNGDISPTNGARIENVTTQTFGTSTATFTVPAGATQAQFQIYQFGIHSFQLDDISVEKLDIAPPPNWISEAEDGTLSGAAAVVSGCGNASNQAFVRLENANENRATFGNIDLDASGSYDLDVDYFYNSGDSFLEFYVNGVFVKEIRFAPSPWCFQGVAGTATIKLPFSKGTNVLTIAAVEGKPSPFLDRLELSESPVHQWFAEAESGSLLGGAALVAGCANASESGLVRLDQSTDNGLRLENVTVPEAGFYKIGFAYFGKGANQSLDVLINGVAIRVTSLPTGNFCFEGAGNYATAIAQLVAGSNTIEAAPQYVAPGQLEPEGYQLFKKSPALKAGDERPHPIFPAIPTSPRMT